MEAVLHYIVRVSADTSKSDPDENTWMWLTPESTDEIGMD